MAIEIAGRSLSIPAGADLRTAQYKFVKYDSGTVVLCAGVTDKPIGVLQNAPNTGQIAQVMVEGISKVVVGSGNLTAPGASIGTDANGLAVAYTEGTDTTKYVAGVLVLPGNAGNIASIALGGPAPHRAA